ncbi:MAG: hypothetical protein ABI352_03235 [Candidatus Dormibacter sp.]
MATPPMLRLSEGRRSSIPDPLVSLNVLGLGVVAVGLLIAGVLAVYDWKTPGAEAPLVLWLAIIAVAVIGLDLAVLVARHRRRLRLGP